MAPWPCLFLYRGTDRLALSRADNLAVNPVLRRDPGPVVSSQRTGLRWRLLRWERRLLVFVHYSVRMKSLCVEIGAVLNRDCV